MIWPSERDRTRPSTHDWERSRRRKRSGWMSPIEIDEKNDAVGPCVDASGRRASLKGFLPVSMARYLELLDWTGRQLRAEKVGSIPVHLAPILQRIGLDALGWCDVVRKFGRIFKRAAGTPESLAGEASRRGQGWLCAPRIRWVSRLSNAASFRSPLKHSVLPAARAELRRRRQSPIPMRLPARI